MFVVVELMLVGFVLVVIVNICQPNVKETIRYSTVAFREQTQGGNVSLGVVYTVDG